MKKQKILLVEACLLLVAFPMFFVSVIEKASAVECNQNWECADAAGGICAYENPTDEYGMCVYGAEPVVLPGEGEACDVSPGCDSDLWCKLMPNRADRRCYDPNAVWVNTNTDEAYFTGAGCDGQGAGNGCTGDASGTCEIRGNELLCVGTEAEMQPPTNLSATGQTGGIRLTWREPAYVPDVYEIFRDGELIDQIDGGVTSYVDAYVTSGYVYEYQIASNDAALANRTALSGATTATASVTTGGTRPPVTPPTGGGGTNPTNPGGTNPVNPGTSLPGGPVGPGGGNPAPVTTLNPIVAPPVVGPTLPQISSGSLSNKSIEQIVTNIVTWMLGIFGTVAIGAFVFAGFQYLLAGGNSSAIDVAKKHMTWSIVGVVVAASGLIIIQAVQAALNAQSIF